MATLSPLFYTIKPGNEKKILEASRIKAKTGPKRYSIS
jgi:hypothetical protein